MGGESKVRVENSETFMANLESRGPSTAFGCRLTSLRMTIGKQVLRFAQDDKLEKLTFAGCSSGVRSQVSGVRS
ncbi:MAG: hypothetical protein DMG81_14965 [Acidobacteria bacterium]|nr:MAG: hypothetical protein DMG81_14965 [Acidobacteriota bacterium]